MAKHQHDLGYVITGLGRSGTTFLAHVFLNAGYDLGGVKPGDIGRHAPPGGGLEERRFVEANMRMQGEVSHKWAGSPSESAAPPDYAQIATRFLPLMEQPWPFVLKDPNFCDTARVWHAAGKIPRHVFLCIRHAAERNKSVAEVFAGAPPIHRMHILRTHQSYYAYFSVFDLLLLCEEQDIPLTIALYPRIGLDRWYAEKVLGPFISDPWTVVRQTWDAGLLHHTSLTASHAHAADL